MLGKSARDAGRVTGFALILGLVTTIGGGCIFLSASDAEVQCASDADCEALDATCDVDNAVCVPRSSGTGSTTTAASGSTGDATSTGAGASGCVSNAQCVDDNGQLPYICRNPNAGEECVSLISEDCSEIFGELEALRTDEAIILGMLSTYTDPVETNLRNPERRRNSVKLAIQEIEKVTKGLPPRTAGAPRRKLVVLSCREEDDVLRATRHLVDVVGVPAIIGPDDDDRTLEAAVEVTIPKGVLMLAAQTKSVGLGELDDASLVWIPEYLGRSNPEAMGEVVPLVEARMREWYGLTETDPLRWAVVLRNDVLGLGLAGKLEEFGQLNGEPLGDQAAADNYRRYPYDTSADFADIAEELAAYEPHIVTIFGEAEGAALFAPLEAAWPAGIPRPTYLIDADSQSDAYKSGISNLIDEPHEIWQRYIGVVPTFPLDDTIFKRFESRYRSEFDNNQPTGVGATAYDSAYMLTYATVAAGSVPQLSGNALAGGLLKLLGPGVTIQAIPDDLTSAFSALSAGTNIDFEGARQGYAFDTARGNSAPTFVFQCLSAGQPIVDKGLLFDPVSGAWDGGLTDGFCNLWPAPPAE